MIMIFWVVVAICTFAATIRLSFRGFNFVEVPENGILYYVLHPRWCILLLIFVPWVVVRFSKGEISPFPWIVFAEVYSQHSFANAFFSSIVVATVYIWLFWTVGQVVIEKSFISEGHLKAEVRAFNLLIGLLFVTGQAYVLLQEAYVLLQEPVKIVVWIVSICTFATTIRLSIRSFSFIEDIDDGLLHYISNPKWCYVLLILVPFMSDAFARGKISPLPWTAFAEAHRQYDFEIALIGLLTVTTIDLWFFWTSGQVYIYEKYIDKSPVCDKRLKNTVRLCNLLFGLLLVTEQNPIYMFIRWFLS